MRLTFFGLTGTVRKKADGKGRNTFEDTISRLGAGGWELVSTQHANREYETDKEDGWRGGLFYAALRSDQIVAYFKRPAEVDRDVTEPPIEL